jgi:hypothetical protein
MDNWIELGTAVEALRKQLYELTKTVDGEDLRFEVESVDVELKVGVTKGGEGGVTAKFWVLEVGGKGTVEAERTQTVTLKLKPRRKGRGAEAIEIGRDDE